MESKDLLPAPKYTDLSRPYYVIRSWGIEKCTLHGVSIFKKDKGWCITYSTKERTYAHDVFETDLYPSAEAAAIALREKVEKSIAAVETLHHA